MNTPLILQIAIGVGSFLLGALVVDMFWIKKTAKPAEAPKTIQPTVELSSEFKKHLLEQTEKDYQAALAQASGQFDQDLASTSQTINGQILRFSTELLASELEQYRTGLVKVREDAIAGMGKVSDEIEKQRQALLDAAAGEVEAEKKRLVDLIDSKLGDAVGAFLIETLGHNVDLGAQSAYLTAMLEEHKEELKQEVTSEK